MTQQVRFITLGCKVNQYETQSMRESLQRAGFEDPFDVNKHAHEGAAASAAFLRPVDFVVINTCTVTHEADKENLYWIRRSRRENPSAKIIVTGCFVEKNREYLQSLPEVDLILANREKAEIAGRLTAGCGSPLVQDDYARRNSRHQYASLSISRSQGKGRVFLKIQDGCNHACTFCKVVMVRGRSRSRNLTDIVEEAKRLRDAGYREIVFSGIQLGAYGLDLAPSPGLIDVLEACAKIEGIEQLRLSSIEPTDVQPRLIEALGTIPKCCPHLHIPLQSGDDFILGQMNRRYSRSFYRDLIVRLKSRLPDFCLTLDVMAGFPGEEDRHFENTVQLLEEIKPLKCHVFPYSSRGGTRAARFKNVPAAVIRQRADTLIRHADRWGREVRTRFLERSFPVLVEKEIGKGNLLQGLTPHYLKVCFQGQRHLIGEIVPAELLTLEGDVFLGKIEER